MAKVSIPNKAKGRGGRVGSGKTPMPKPTVESKRRSNIFGSPGKQVPAKRGGGNAGFGFTKKLLG